MSRSKAIFSGVVYRFRLFHPNSQPLRKTFQFIDPLPKMLTFRS